MSPSDGSFGISEMLAERGIGLASLGGAYLFLLATAICAAAGFVAARHYLLVSPNRWARDYGLYVAIVIATLLIATTLQNELAPHGDATLYYVAAPQLMIVLAIHVAITYRPDPWLVMLGSTAMAATGVVALLGAATANLLRPAYAVAWVVLAALLVLLWRKSVSTKHAFKNASSIYLGSKETMNTATPAQRPWLGWPQWMALVAASVLLALCNSLLRGTNLEDVPALDVAAGSAAQLLVTVALGAIPATLYWLARRRWMPELTRLVWLAWLVVGFAFTYGNYLRSLRPV